MSPNGSDRDRMGATFSPPALAELSRYLTLQSYLPKNGGLFGSGWAQFMADRAASPPVSTPTDQQQGVQPTPSSVPAVGAAPRPNSSYQLAALSSPSRSPIPVPGCASCHGPSQSPVTPSSAPPFPPGADDPWTFYPNISRRDGRGWGTSPSRSGDDHPQCEIQLRSDGSICGSQPDDEGKAICRASATKRYSHCLYTGEVGNPALDTYKRLQGEPPIRRWRKPR
jgi:hypothetical protein